MLRREPLPPWRRAEILDRAATLLAERHEEFARTIADEAAKPIKTARVEAERAVSTFPFAAAEARALTGEMVPMDASDVGEGKLGFVLRVPVGVVGAISPFNFPLNLVAHKVAPAIAGGCPVVLKPASQTPLSAHRARRAAARRVRAARRAGSTSSPAAAATVGDPLVDHPDVALDHVHGLAARSVGASASARRARRSGSSSATTRR